MLGFLFVDEADFERDPDDVASSPVSSYQLWASAFPAIGAPSDDSDGDGQSNFLEYALGTLPSDPASLQTPAVVPIAGRPGFALTKGPAAAADPSVAYLIEGSSDLHHWSHSLPDIEVLANDNTSYRVQYLGDSPHFFFRLKVGPP